MSEVKQGDLVLVKRDKENKLSTRFEPQLCKVKDKERNQVFVSDNNNPARLLCKNKAEVTHCQFTDAQPNSTKKLGWRRMFPQLWLRRINKVLICKKEGASWRYPQRILKAPDKMNL